MRPLRWGNWKRWADYKKSFEQRTSSAEFCDSLTEEQQRDEELMIRLRLTQGLDLTEFNLKYGLVNQENFDKSKELLMDKGMLTQEGAVLRLTEKGLLLADEITLFLVAGWE